MSHEAGGAKIGDSYHTVFRHNLAAHNLGKGLWWDVNSYDAVIVGNEVRSNASRGIAFEVSAKALIASNLFVDHTDPKSFAFLVNEANDVQLYNNTFHNNHVSIAVTEGDRAQTRTITLENGQKIGIRTDVAQVTIKNNLISYNRAPVKDSFLVTVRDWTKRRDAQQMIAAMNNNGYYRASAKAPAAAVRWGPGGGRNPILYTSVPQFSSATGRERQALVIDNQGTNPFFVDPAKGNFRLKAGSPARGRGEALPPAVARAIGVQAGVRVDLGALVWR